ncbi:MAG: GNAT family N-acetyltransferase [Solirubrobacterales bacterium]|nr:GNAT family N-acetyltransferase [Solirubrobacterales bacterium]MBV9421987.1 GNAT family N-acetyltransferase [Solirubrobacterales bacterium]
MPGASSRSTPALSGSGVAAIDCRLAAGEDELEAHFELRRAVFVHEQELFALDDRDERDDEPTTLHAVGLLDGEPRGAVRLYPLEASWREWKGDRLAVLPELRTHHLGAELVRFAVSTAGGLGGARMVAHVQLPNVRFFEHLGWRREGTPAPFHGLDHQLMSIRLDRGA